MKGIQKEITIMRLFDDPHMLQIYEIYQTEKSCFMVMELMEGGELFQKILAINAFTEKDACILMRQLLRCAEYMNKIDVIHRDIKPENIMLKSKDSLEIKIIDFGLAEFRHDPDVLFKKSGTPGYCAPEVLSGKVYDTKSDVFSLGVIMYQVLSGCSPFFGESIDEIVRLNTAAIVYFNF